MIGLKPSAKSIVDDPRLGWVKHQIKPPECFDIINEIHRRKCTTAIEVGVCSGYSSAIIYAALADNTRTPILHAIDRRDRCDFDETKQIGTAFYQIHGLSAGYNLITNAVSADAFDASEIDFAFIDADHRHPWPTLDLLAIWCYLKPQAVIAFHDTAPDWPWTGPIAIVNAWTGEKWSSPNLAFCHNVTEAIVVESAATALRVDWDVEIDSTVLVRYRACIAERFAEPGRSTLLAILDDRTAGSQRQCLLPVEELDPLVWEAAQILIPSSSGRQPWERKMRFIDVFQMAMRENAIPRDHVFLNYRHEPFLVAHFQGHSIGAHFPAIAAFLDAEVSVPDNVTIITFVTSDAVPQALLLWQLDKAGVPYVNAAQHIDEFGGWKNTRKIELLANLLPDIKSEYVLVLDGLDVLLCGHLDSIFRRFYSYKTRILFGAMTYPWPPGYLPKTGEGDLQLGKFGFLCAGTVFGYSSDLATFYQRAAQVWERWPNQENFSEQLIIRATLADDPLAASFDHRCTVFQSFARTEFEQDGKVIVIK